MKNNYFLILLLTLCCISFSANAQKTSPPLSDEVKESTGIIESLDSLTKLWYVKTSTPAKNKKSMNIHGFKPDEVPVYSDSVYAARIKKIISPLPYTYNKQVKGFIDLYAIRKRDLVEKMLGLSEYYFPIYEEILDKNNMPMEIKYLSIVESALNPRAVSRAGATGLWQFMYSTGRLYNLDINSYIDERKDPYKSTEAAVRYLHDLHNIFGDWFLAIAAYNCGPGNVQKAIRRSGGKRTFWEIYNYLPAETRGYVPAFIAASYVFTYHREHNLYPQVINLPLMVDTVLITQEISFESISKVLNVPVEMITDLNPHFKKNIVPTRTSPYVLRLPASKSYAFTTYKDSIYRLYAGNFPKEEDNNTLVSNDTDKNEDANEKDNNVLTTSVSNAPNKDDDENVKPSTEKVTIYYTVKSGDYLGGIADWFDVSLYSLRRWNRIQGSRIRAGQKLKILVPANKVAYYKKINSMTAIQKKNLGKNPEPIVKKTEEKTVVKKTEVNKGNTIYYTVQKGDTLWSIAQRYPGVTVSQIKEVNGIKDNRSIKPGQKIKIIKG